MKIIIFGVGIHYELRKKMFNNDIEIMGLFDNDSTKWGNVIDGQAILPPADIKFVEFDYAVIMSYLYFNEIKKQLVEMGVEKEKIKLHSEFYGKLNWGKLEFFFRPGYGAVSREKKILVVFPLLVYGSMFSLAESMIQALNRKCYDVTVAAYMAQSECVCELTKMGAAVITYANLCSSKPEELFWVQEFDCVIVNTCRLVEFAVTVSRLVPAFLWLHDSYKLVAATPDHIMEKIKEDVTSLQLYAVSQVAKQAFWDCYDTTCAVSVLPCGINDIGYQERNPQRQKMVVAIIGVVYPIKAQDIFLSAIEQLDEDTIQNTEFWIIGQISNEGYGKEIRQRALKMPGTKIWGQLSRKEMVELYKEIDVVVSPSREDTLSMVTVEGLMSGAVCITSEAAGIAAFLEEGVSGFICKKENAQDLADKLQWVLRHRNEAKRIGVRGRQVYERYFSIDAFAKNLDTAIQKSARK